MSNIRLVKKEENHDNIRFGINQSYYNEVVRRLQNTNVNETVELLNSNKYLDSKTLKKHKDRLKQYKSDFEYLNEIQKLTSDDYDEPSYIESSKWLEDFTNFFDERESTFSKFKNETEYNEYVQYLKTQDEMRGYDSVSGSSNIEDLKSKLSSLEKEKNDFDNSYKSNGGWIPSSSNYNRPAQSQVGAYKEWSAKSTEYAKKIKDLKNEIYQKEQYHNEAVDLQEFEGFQGIIKNADFEEKSQKGMARNNPTPNKVETIEKIDGKWYTTGALGKKKEIKNILTFVRDNADSYGNVRVNEDFQKLLKATDDEVLRYSYLLEVDEKKAQRYLDLLMPTLLDKRSDDLKERLDIPVVKHIASVGQGMASYIDSVGIKDFSNDSSMVAMQKLQSEAEGLDKYLMGAGQNIGNMLPSIMLSYLTSGIASGLGASTKVASAIGNLTNATSVGFSAKGSAYEQKIAEGWNPDDAQTYSTLVGISEASLEAILSGIVGTTGFGAEDLLKKADMIDNALLKFTTKSAIRLSSEELEEIAQLFLEPTFEVIVKGGNYNQPTIDELIETAIVTAISTGTLNSPSAISDAVDSFKKIQLGKYIKDAGQTRNLVDLGKSLGEGTKSNELASKITDKSRGLAISKLLDVVANDIPNANKTDMINAFVEKGFNPTEAKSIVNKIFEEGIDSVANIRGMTTPTQAYNDVLNNPNSTISQREEAYRGIFQGVANNRLQKAFDKAVKNKAKSTNAKVSTDDKGKDLTQAENPVESKFESNTEGKDFNSANDKIIASKKLISSEKDNMKFEVTYEDGTTEEVDANNINFGNDGESLVYSAVMDMNLPVGIAESLIGGYKGNDIKSAGTYINGVREAFVFGKYNQEADLNNGTYASQLTEEQRSNAFKLGKIYANEKAIADEKAIKAETEPTDIKKQEGKVHFEGDTLSLTSVQDVSIKNLDVLTKAIGKDIHIFESYKDENGKYVYKDANGNIKSAPNGFYNQADGSIWIDLNAGNRGQGVMMYTVAHELTHFIKQWSPTKFKALADFLVEQYGKKGVSVADLVREQQEKAKEHGREISYDVAFEEMVADSMESMLTDGKVIKELAKKDKGLFNKIKSWIDNLLRRLNKEYKNYTPESNEGQMIFEAKETFKEVQKLFTDALVDSSENYSNASVEAQKNITTEGDVKFMARNDVLSWDINWDSDNFSDIKSQLIEHQDEVNKMKVVTKVNYTHSNKKALSEEVNELLKNKFGYKIETQNYGTILFDPKAIDKTMDYINNPAEAAALLAAPYVLKRGKAISGHKNHKNKGNPSVTFAAPVELNGEIGNVAVAVLYGTKHRIHALRVLTPSGKVFELSKTKDTESTSAGSTTKSSVRSAIDSVSKDSIPQTSKKSQEKYSDRDEIPTDTATQINQSMTMEDAKTMIQKSFVSAGIKDFYDDAYNNGDEWIKGEGVDEVAMYIENEYSLQAKYLDKIPAYLNGDITVEEILQAYLDGTLVGKAKPKANRVDTSKNYRINDTRFYSPKHIENIKELFEIAGQKLTVKNRAEVSSARAKILLFAHNEGASELLGLTKTELNKKLRSWSGYTTGAKDISQRINKGVADSNKWTGIENCSWLVKSQVSAEELESLVKEIKGTSSQYERNYIARTMLALDTHIDWTELIFDFKRGYADENRKTVRGLYNNSNRTITVGGSSGMNTVAHEMGHALDYKWQRDLFGEQRDTQPLTENSYILDLIQDEEGKQFYKNFRIFVDSLTDVNDNHSSYTMDTSEVFARFVARFVEWVETTAGGRNFRETDYYNDKFTGSQYVEFVKLLQEKAMLDAKKMETATMDITDSMEESVLYEGQVLYSERDTDSVSTRSLLANALESVAENDIEKNKLSQYKEKIALIEAEQKKLHELREKLFTKGIKGDERREIQEEATRTANRITTYDRQLFNLESTTALKNVLTREKELARKRQKQRDAENLKAYKEKVAETTRQLLEKNRESRERALEGRNKTEMRHKVKKVVNDLNKLLLNPTKERHIPEEMRVAVAEALDIVNMDTVDAETRVARYNELIAKEKNPDVIASLTESRDRILNQGNKLSEKLGKLKDAYAMIEASADDNLKSMYDDVIYSKIESVQKDVGKTPLRNMTLKQLESVYELYKMVLTTVRDSNKAFAEDLKMTRQALGSNTFAEIKENNKARDRIKFEGIEKFGWKNLKPMQAMKTIGSGILQQLWNNILYGQEVFAQDYDEAVKFAKEMKEKYGYNKWDLGKLYSFESKSGKVMKINLEQMMSIYAYSKRKQADDHIEKGGILLNESIIKEKKLGRTVEVKVNDSTAYRLDKMQVTKIIDTLEKEFPGAKGFVDEMQGYLSVVMGEKGNEVSMKMYGIKLFKEEHYFPLKSSKDFMESANAKIKGDVKIKNKGMTKSTVEHASNPIVLEGFLDVWGNHVNEMAMYHGLVLPLEDFSRTLNYGFKADDKLNADAESVRTALRSAFGESADNYLNELLKAINGGVLHDSSTEFADKMISQFKKAKVMASLSVIVQQPTAIIRAMGIIDPKYFVAQNFHHKQTWEELKKYCPTAIIKETGSFDTNMGRTIVDMVKEDRKFTEKVGDALGKAPAWMDEMGWNMIWRALKKKVATEQNLSGEALLKECGKQMTLIINETQVYDSVMSRNELMRSKSALTKMATAFMGEASTVANMIYGAALDFKRGKKGIATKTVAAVVSSVIVNGLVSSLVYALRDDDEEKTWLEKYLASATTEVIDGINPLTYIPYIKDAYSLFQGYDVERTDMSLIGDVVDALDDFFNVFDPEAYEDMSRGEIAKHIYESSIPLLTSICDMFGLPVGNILRDAEAIIVNDNLSMSKTSGEGLGLASKEGLLNASPKFVEKFVDDEKYHKLYLIANNGNTAYVKNEVAEMVADKVKTTEEDNPYKIEKKAKQSVKASFTGVYRDEYKKAYKNKDSKEMNRIRKFLYATGLWDSLRELDSLLEKWRKAD